MDPQPNRVPRGWVITDPNAEAGAIETLPPTPGLQVQTWQHLAASPVHFPNAARVCVTSESALATVAPRLPQATSVQAVATLKDKLACRRLLEPLFPHIQAQTVLLRDLPAFPFDPARSYVVKPARGCFGSGVRMVTAASDLRELADAIANEVARHGAVLSDTVLSAETLIVEPFIEGEEYAVDMFYDDAGRPVITGIYHHPIPWNPAYLHMIYYTTRELFDRFYAPLTAFFTVFGELLQVRAFPIHAEFRLQRGAFVPIEFNPLRFGGMGLGNLAYHTLGVNAYQHFLDGTAPDWEQIWATASPAAYAFVIAYNGSRVDVQRQQPDWAALRRRFSRIHREVRFDHRRQLACGILYVEEPPERIAELLRLEFDDFFVPRMGDAEQTR